ncbi:MalY/PatB family protein [Virgibacillus sp. W0181]|uniref:MalY/PatB family protein n=1 Tax=Virgibacillus sp. W0181 TaxID=3391581 RepID=UPI003F452DFA
MNLFHDVYNRKMTKSFKWDAIDTIFKSNDVLPMWVADMDFKAPEAVNEAIKQRAEHGIYGYTIIDQPVKDSIIDWISNNHNWPINDEWLSFSPGVITSLHVAIQNFTEPGDKVLLQTPVYTPFFQIIKGGNRQVVESPLTLEENYYRIDFADFENKLKQGVKAFILCSPHNPVGRVWTKDELNEMARLCLKYDVLILADEIHADLIYPEYNHIPIASLSEKIADNTITCMSPTKTFNLAGLKASYIITSNEQKRAIINEALARQGYSMLNTIGVVAMEAAYKQGLPWLEKLMKLLATHKNFVTEQLEANTTLKVIRSEGTYLLWIDCSSLGMNNEELQKFMIEKAKVGLNPGIAYGENGASFMRINIACPRKTLEDGVNRIIHAVEQIEPRKS